MKPWGGPAYLLVLVVLVLSPVPGIFASPAFATSVPGGDNQTAQGGIENQPASPSDPLPWTFVAATWGGGSLEPLPGEVLVPLTVTLLESNSGLIGTYSVADVSANLTLPAGVFTNSTGGNTAMAYASGAYSLGDEVHLVFVVDIGASASLGIHMLNLTIGSVIQTSSETTLAQPLTLPLPVPLWGRENLVERVVGSGLSPGQTSMVALEIQNVGTAPVYSLGLSVLPGEAVLNGSGQFYALQVLPGATWSLKVSLYAGQGLSGITFPLRLNGTYTNAYGFHRDFIDAVPISVGTSSGTLLTVGRIGIQPGLSSVSANFTNPSPGRMSNVTLTASAPQPFALLGKTAWFYSSISPDQTVNLDVQVYAPDSTLGRVLTIGVSISYVSASGSFVVQNNTIQLLVSTSSSSIAPFIVASPVSVKGTGGESQVYPGDSDVALTLSLANAGSSDALNTTAYLALPSGLSAAFGGSTESFVGTMGAGQGAQVVFYLDVGTQVSPGSYNLSLNVSYSGNNAGKVYQLPFLVSTAATFEVNSVEVVSSALGGTVSSLYPGGVSGVVRVTLQNTGSTTSLTTVAQLLAGNEFGAQPTATSQTSVVAQDLMGTVAAGQGAVAVFYVDVDPSTPVGTYIATLSLVWTQGGTSRQFSQELPISLNVTQPPFTLPLGTITIGAYSLGTLYVPVLYVVVPILILVLVVLYFVFRRRHQRALRGRSEEMKPSGPTTSEHS